MSDVLVYQLRDIAGYIRSENGYTGKTAATTMIAAAYRIEGLERENARLRLSSVDLLDSVDRDYNRRTNAIVEHHASKMSDLIKQRDTAWNDAIEAAARVVADGFDRGIKSPQDQCNHDKYRWEDCEECCIDAIRTLRR